MNVSPIWFHFTVLPEDKTKAKCHICRKHLSFKTSSTNLYKHMRSVHPTVVLRRENPNNPSSSRSTQPSENPNNPTSSGSTQPPANQSSSSSPGSSQPPADRNSSSSSGSMQPPETIDLTQPSTSSGSSHCKSSTPSTSTSTPDDESQEQQTSNPTMSPTSSLKRKHQPSMAGFVKRQMTHSDKKTLDNKVFNLFTRDLQPFSVVEDEGFRELLGYLAPEYTIPSRKYFSNTYLNAAYQRDRDIALKKLRTADSVCITTDHWTSSHGKKTSYIGVTAHFIDQNFNFIHLTLECRKFSGEHTGVNIAEDLTNILTEWEVLEKVLIMISDNAPNIVCAIKTEMMKKHFGCFAHKLNLCVQNSLLLKELDDVIDDEDLDKLLDQQEDGNAAVIMLKKIKKVVKFFNKSPQALEKLFKSQTLLGAKEPKSLVNSVRTRWNSVFYMLARFLELKEPIKITLASLNNPTLPVLTEEEWQIAQELKDLLQPFEAATNEMSGENFLTASKIIPITNGLVLVTQDCIKKEITTAVWAIGSMLIKLLKKWFENIEHSKTIAMTTFLDPRFKNKAFEDPVAVRSIQKEVVEQVAKIIKDSRNQTKEKGSSTSQPQVNPAKKKKEPAVYWNHFRDKQKKFPQALADATASAVLEVQKYLSEEPLDLQENPLKWWKANAHHYPNLSKLVRMRCCMVATSVPCERVFSVGGLILTERRSRLLHPKVNKIMFLHNNQQLHKL